MDQEFSDFLVFVDESGDHSLDSIDAHYPVFVLCFCIVSKDTYINNITPAIRQIKTRLFGHDLVILHEHEIRKKKGDFSKLGPEQRHQLMEELGQTIRDHEITIVAVVIDKVRHKERYTQPYHPYHLALKFGLERIYKFMFHEGQNDRVTHVVCEARGPKEDKELELEFLRVCDGDNRSGRPYPFKLILKNKQSNSEGLQLADLTARPVGLSILRPDQPNQAYEVIKTKLYRGNQDCVTGNGLKVFP